MKREAYVFADSEKVEDAKRCYDACLQGQDMAMRHLILHYSTHTGLNNVGAAAARQSFLEVASRMGGIDRVEYMTKLKHYCFCLGIEL